MKEEQKKALKKRFEKARKSGKAIQGGVADKIIDFSKVDKPKK